MAAATVKGVVALAKGAPVEVREIVVPDPGPGEVRVTVQACGVCHTDLHYREGAINDEFPFLLGHEAAGVVESVGPDVTDVAPGDFVSSTGARCAARAGRAVAGRPWYCFATFNATQKMTLTDGTPLSPALGIGAFAEQTLVAAGQATKVEPGGQAGDRRAARVRRDGRPRRRDVHRRRRPRRQRRGVRLRRRGQRRDRRARASPAPTRSSPSTSTPEARVGRGVRRHAHRRTRGETDAVEAIRALTDGNGADVCIEAVGRPEVLEQAFYARDLAGTVVQVGVPDPTMKIELPMIEFFGRGGALKPSWYGDCLPSRDFPMLIDLYLSGRLDLDRFVSETITLDAVEDAFHKMERGEVLRSVVVL